MNSYCAKLETARGLLYWVRLLCVIHDQPIPLDIDLQLWMDNKHALKRAMHESIHCPQDATGAEYDIMHGILMVRRELGVSFRGGHVYSYHNQMKRKAVQVELNAFCDEGTRQFLHHSDTVWHTRPSANASSSEKATLYID